MKQRIIEEAYRLFITKGMKQTSFCDVAVAVHKSKGAVIHYFPSKKKLIDAVVRMRFFPDSQISCEMYSLADKDWNEFLRQYRNPIERVINSFPKHLNGNLLICYMQFVSSAHEYMDEFPQMYQQLLIREQDFLWLSGNFWLVSFKISYLCLPLFYETRTTPSCHPSGCAYRQL